MSQESIARVLSLYSIALDSHSWDLFDEIFTPNVEVSYPVALHWHDLASFKRDFTQMHEAVAGHQHFLGVPYLIVKGDRAFALTYGRFNFFKVSPAAGPAEMSEGGAWYDDELVRLPEGWRVCKRSVGNFWWRGAMPAEGDVPRVVDSFPEWVKAGRVGYMNALRESLGHGATAP
jgi:SnoaL-like domain